MEALNTSESHTVVFDEDDLESHIVRTIFKNVHFIIDGMNSKPTRFEYSMFKDMFEASKLNPMEYLQLFNNMFYSYLDGLPTPKQK